MTNTTYNTRTLASCAKRLRWMTNELDTMPTWSIVWRWREGYRLQVDGEQHEPGGCLWIDMDVDRVEEALAKGQADECALDCLEELLDTAIESFDDESLKHLCLDRRLGGLAFQRWTERSIARRPELLAQLNSH